jgi:hypothetical protein
LVAKILPVAIAAPTMVEDEWRLGGIGISEACEQLSRLNRLGTLFALI